VDSLFGKTSKLTRAIDEGATCVRQKITYERLRPTQIYYWKKRHYVNML